MPETVKEGLVTVTDPALIVSVAGEKVKALGTLSIRRVEFVVRVPSLRDPVMVVPSGASPQVPAGPVFHWVVIVSPVVTAVEA